MTLPVFGNLGIQLGGSYVRRGSTFSILQLGDIIYELNYAEFSALAKARVPLMGERVSLHLLAGPTVGMEVSCEGTIVATLQPITIVDECADEGPGDTIDTPTTALDFGVAGGAGVEVRIVERVGLSLELLYTLGLRSIYDGPLDQTVKNRAMTVQAGLVFPIR